MSEFGNGVVVAVGRSKMISISSMSSGAPPRKPRGLVE
jgi:hypothetical protein